MSKFLKLIPLAIEIARIVEVAVPMEGQGKNKLAFAVDTATSIYEAEGDLRASWGDKNAFLEAFTRATATSVRLMNAAGLFKK